MMDISSTIEEYSYFFYIEVIVPNHNEVPGTSCYNTKNKIKGREQNHTTKNQIKKSLLELAENPYWMINLNIKKLARYEDSYRLRIGKYRELYKIFYSNCVLKNPST
jgi:mRNA-degrading endonuclease RelE of RelBE toxin-antitoxin system